MSETRLRPDDWCEAALNAIAKDGIGAVAVEPIARSLQVSKGSFYWHFKNRDALLAAAVRRWEAVRTDEVIVALLEVTEPRERLRATFAGAYGKPRASRIEAALVASRNDPIVAPVLRRVTKRRVAFLVDIFTALGFRPEDAAHRASIAYGTYVGLSVMKYANPAAVPSQYAPTDAFLDDLVGLLTRA